MPVAQHNAPLVLAQSVVGRLVGVAMNQPGRLGGLHPGRGHLRIGIRIGGAALLALLAFTAGGLANRAAHSQWLGQQLLLPGGRARQSAKLLVLHIVQTQCIAVAEQNIRARPVQHGGLSQAGHAAAAQKFIPRQKVAVAHHEEQGAFLGGLTQQASAFGFKAARLIQRIVTHPDFKQIAQHKDGVCRAALQIVAPCLHSLWFCGLQMQIGNKVDHAPARRALQLRHKRSSRAGI